jgi:N4-gp56 family major capsid protein
MRLTGNGVGEGVTLEGNEEKLTTYSFNLTLQELAHAVRDEGPMTRQRVAFSIDEESEQAIKDWGTEKIDDLCFTALRTSPTTIFYLSAATTVAKTGTAATAKAGLAAKITPQLISHVKAWAKTGGNRSQTPLRPIKINGKKYYMIVTHPDSLYDLKRNTEFTQALREAEKRGKDHPLFEEAVAIWDGVIIFEHEDISIATDGGAGGATAWCHAHFLGAQALAWAWGKRPEVIPEEFDYRREHGYGFNFTYAVGKPSFNSLDYGAVSLYLERTQIADA